MRKELEVYIRARYPLLWIVTPEEERALGEIAKLAVDLRRRLFHWSVTSGETNPALRDREERTRREPQAILNAILETNDPAIWVLRDFHPFLKDIAVVRRLREVAFALQRSQKTVLILGPVLKIPRELEKEITVVDFALPSAEEIDRLLGEIEHSAGQNGQIVLDLNRRERDQLVRACLGLTSTEAANAIAKAIIEANGRLDGHAIEAVGAEKRQIIRKSGLLEYYAGGDRLDDVGGLATLKEWLRKRVRAFPIRRELLACQSRKEFCWWVYRAAASRWWPSRWPMPGGCPSCAWTWGGFSIPWSAPARRICATPSGWPSPWRRWCSG